MSIDSMSQKILGKTRRGRIDNFSFQMKRTISCLVVTPSDLRVLTALKRLKSSAIYLHHLKKKHKC